MDEESCSSPDGCSLKEEAEEDEATSLKASLLQHSRKGLLEHSKAGAEAAAVSALEARKEEILLELAKIESALEEEEEATEFHEQEETDDESEETSEGRDSITAEHTDTGKPGQIIYAKDYLDEAQLAERTKRLNNGLTEKLYHQTSMAACKAIFKNGKGSENFKPGSYGIAGPGIYFAVKAFHTGWKAQKFGCMIEALVQTGTVLETSYDADKSLTGEKMLQDKKDSVWIPRGGKKGRNTGSLPEVVVYFNDQIVGMTYYSCDKKTGKRHGRFLAPELRNYTRHCSGASAVHHCKDCLTKVYKGGCESPYEPEEPCQCGESCVKYDSCCPDRTEVCSAK